MDHAARTELSEHDNAQAFEALLQDLCAATDVQRDRGTRFEALIRDFFTRDEAYADQFTAVQTFAQWAEEQRGRGDAAITGYLRHAGGRDTGIDLVATNADDGSFTAIQCKLRQSGHRVAKDELDSFISASDTSFFTRRYLVATTDDFSEPARRELHSKTPPVLLILRSDLQASQLNWADYRRGQLTRIRKQQPRPYQEEAVAAVTQGLREHERGQLIMACGTGKTFTALRIAEQQTGGQGFVLFLVPSLSLLSQTLTAWKRQARRKLTAMAVCSDRKTGKVGNDDATDVTRPDELSFPATTDAAELARQAARLRPKARGMSVVFSTYHSLGVISAAQHEHDLGDFDLIICDEAHRTAGYRVRAEDEPSIFTRVHDAEFVRGQRRLYMTATPRIYGSGPKEQEESGAIAELCSMDDETLYGRPFYTYTFDAAVHAGHLADYKVLVLCVDSRDLLAPSVPERPVEGVLTDGAAAALPPRSPRGEDDAALSLRHAAKIIGCYRALAKRTAEGLSDDRSAPMRRAVAFAQSIHPAQGRAELVSSRQFARRFEATVEEFRRQRLSEAGTEAQRAALAQDFALHCRCDHIDGGMDALEKERHLRWLREDPAEGECRILFNVRCLSEGVDVPALDAVIFLAPRRSPIDVVQAVGRVMRTAPGKRRGYVIIPIVLEPGFEGSDVGLDHKDFQIVFDVLGALKTIDAHFGAKIDGQLQQINPDYFEVLCLRRPLPTGGGQGAAPREPSLSSGTGEWDGGGGEGSQTDLGFKHDQALEASLRVQVVRKLGNRREWGDWAEEVGGICAAQARRIEQLLTANDDAAQAFAAFAAALRRTLHGELRAGEMVEMLAQHLVIRPVIAALFRDFPFVQHNPLAVALDEVLTQLQAAGLETADRALFGFSQAVDYRLRNIHTPAQRQSVILELFDRFFKYAFPKQQERLGIVYTPVAIVDFILRSCDELLRRECGRSLGDAGVHILDPFTGTATFLTRLLQSGLIPPGRLRQKYEQELHGCEIVPLAYYIACMNLESTWQELSGERDYRPNAALIFTDSFAAADDREDDGGLFGAGLAVNEARRQQLRQAPLRVIIANPPYSVGQESANDDNQNVAYPALDARIAQTYAARTTATLKSSLYDAYVRAFRLASDRLGEEGVIGFVTNAGWLEGQSMNGLRQCLSEEFSAVYVLNLRGNQRTSGELSRKEGGKVFGSGSRAPVAITLLVRKPGHTGPAAIHYYAVEDYLSREDKLARLRAFGSVSQVRWTMLTPDAHGDWLNQRHPGFERFMALGDKRGGGPALFAQYSNGLKTNRDTWCYNSDPEALQRHMSATITFYNAQAAACAADEGHALVMDERKITWDWAQKRGALRGQQTGDLDPRQLTQALYRPFFPQYVYFDRFWNNRVYQLPALFGERGEHENRCLCVNAGYKSFEDSGFIALMTDRIPDLHLVGDSQCFPRWLYPKDGAGALLTAGRMEAITAAGLRHFQEAYRHGAQHIDAEVLFYYIYGLLHSEDYLRRYATSLGKQLPRIPRVATLEQFRAFERAGRRLADLHAGYERVEPYDGCEIVAAGAHPTYRVEKLRYGKGGDRSVIHLNAAVAIRSIPLEAQKYVINRKSALDWLVERCGRRTDKKSGLENDFNAWVARSGDEQWLLKHILRVITVSLETMKIVRGLPPLELHREDAEDE